jgi:hypothetical protein
MTIRKQLISIFVVFMLIAGFSGCELSQQSAVAGKYVLEGEPRSYMELKADGTFFLAQWGKYTKKTASFAGEYTMDGNQITIKLPQGTAARGHIDGDVLVDDEGERWIKQ